MKQTAVDFAVEQLEKLIPSGNQIIIGIIIKKAKEMEKEHIMQALNDGKEMAIFPDLNKSIEQYYQENYQENA